MLTFKNNLTLLSEAAAIDLKMSTEENMKFSVVKEAYSAIPEMEEITVTEATDVPVLHTKSNEYYVEFVNLAPFMKDAGLTDIAEALDLVAVANGLDKTKVGLVIESQSSVENFLEAAKKKSTETKNAKTVNTAVKKVAKSNSVAKNLIEKGYSVKKKKSDSAVCPKCGKATTKCSCKECGDMSSGAASPSVGKTNVVEQKMVNVSEANKTVGKCPTCGKATKDCTCGKSKKECDTTSTSKNLIK